MKTMTGVHRSTVRVVKFGGSSVTGDGGIDTIARVTRDRLTRCRPVLVVSAFANVTARLERIALAAASTGRVPVELEHLASTHRRKVREMVGSHAAVGAIVDALLAECAESLGRTAARGVCSPEALDAILSFGERLSSEIVAAGLVRREIAAVAVDAADLIVTDATHGDARGDLAATRARVDDRLPAAPAVPVVTGFLGATPSGVRTTLGREGSDYTAGILGVCLGAEAVEIWTDVDGVMTADPRVVSDARPLRRLSYEQLFDLTSWGAKVVHPKTVKPLHDAAIPLEIRNTTCPVDAGTRVDPAGEEVAAGPLGVTRLDVTALRAPGHGTPSTDDARRQLEPLLRALDETGLACSVITIVRRRAGVVAREADAIVCALGDAGVRVLGVHEGRDGATLSFGVPRADADSALRAVHDVIFSPVLAGRIHA